MHPADSQPEEETPLLPLAWEEVLVEVANRLGASRRQRFERLHRNFVSYPTEHTLKAFYGFAFDHELRPLLARFRATRIEAIWKALQPRLAPGQRVLDVGAGPGILSQRIRRCVEAGDAQGLLLAQDISPEVTAHLRDLGVPMLPEAPDAIQPLRRSFDCIVCADSLGETHADDDLPACPDATRSPEEWAQAFEERYGLAHKLTPWIDFLAPLGQVFLWEPFRHAAWNKVAALSLEAAGWHTRFVEEDQAPYLILTRPTAAS